MGNLGPGVFSLLVANKHLLTACGTSFLFCSVFAFSVWFCFAKGIWCSPLTPYALGRMSYFLFCSLPFYLVPNTRKGNYMVSFRLYRTSVSHLISSLKGMLPHPSPSTDTKELSFCHCLGIVCDGKDTLSFN